MLWNGNIVAYIFHTDFQIWIFHSEEILCLPIGEKIQHQVYTIIWNTPKMFCHVDHTLLSDHEEDFPRNFTSSITVFLSFFSHTLFFYAWQGENINCSPGATLENIHKESTSVLDQLLNWCLDTSWSHSQPEMRKKQEIKISYFSVLSFHFSFAFS